MARVHRTTEECAWYVCRACHNFITHGITPPRHPDIGEQIRRNNCGAATFTPLTPLLAHDFLPRQVRSLYGTTCNACGAQIAQGRWELPVTATIERRNDHT